MFHSIFNFIFVFALIAVAVVVDGGSATDADAYFCFCSYCCFIVVASVGAVVAAAVNVIIYGC